MYAVTPGYSSTWCEPTQPERMGATTVEVTSSHVAMVSHPDEVAQLIETAAKTVQAGR